MRHTHTHAFTHQHTTSTRPHAPHLEQSSVCGASKAGVWDGHIRASQRSTQPGHGGRPSRGDGKHPSAVRGSNKRRSATRAFRHVLKGMEAAVLDIALKLPPHTKFIHDA
jgi:hypothetical protein